MINNFLKVLLISFITFSLAGCTFIFQAGRRSDAQKIQELNTQLDELARAKGLLEQKLGSEINDKQIKLQMMEKGLVITFVADVLFDLADSVAHVAILLQAFMPETAKKILGRLKISAPEMIRIDSEFSKPLVVPGTAIEKGEPLFPRLDEKTS